MKNTEPVVTYKISIRCDVANPGKFVYSSHTDIRHALADDCKFYGLKPD
jgi:hypothetical protein